MGEGLQVTMVDAMPVVGAIRPYIWQIEARKLERENPDWIVTYDIGRGQLTALCWKYLDLGWIYAQSPEHMTYVIDEVTRKEVPWEVEGR